ncbi:MAG: DUF3656 domain-containing protein [Pirellulales bacterium]
MATTPELLSPAGNKECIRAAIENGADAVYFGLDCGFNARARAANFCVADLPAVMEMLHARGLKGYVTLNVLVFSNELPEFEKVVRACHKAGVDAVLVQDVGAACLIRDVCPDLPIHGSTQMTLTSAESIRLAQALNMQRVVLARELSLDEILSIRAGTAMPLEVFVHGALCVAYSGQCLTSESLGGRSANRGQCAQACRLPYELVCDGRHMDLGNKKYLLSPQDLAAHALIPKLIEAGIASFKIEGRLKTPEYVANITSHYRRVIDDVVASRPISLGKQDIEAMELSFSRGFSNGWLEGCDHKTLVPATTSAKRGVRLGRVVNVRRGAVQVELAEQLVGGVKRGDGVAFECGNNSDEAEGGRVYEVFQSGVSRKDSVVSGHVELTFAHEGFDLTRISTGQTVWKTDDPQLTSKLRKTFTHDKPLRRHPVDIHVQIEVGSPLVLKATTDSGAETEVRSDEDAKEARKHPVSLSLLNEQFGRLGGTEFVLRQMTADIQGRPMLPFSILGAVRKKLVRQLQSSMKLQHAREIVPKDPNGAMPLSNAEDPSESCTADERKSPGTLHILARSLSQVASVLDLGERNIYVDFSDIRQYRDAISMARSARATIFLATPRIQKPDELGVFHLLAKLEPDGILVRNYGALSFFREIDIPVVGDYSLNITNKYSADFFRREGLVRVTASYDCNREQLLTLITSTRSERIEVVIHQHMPLFHMEHCVFCNVLSEGTNKHNCGRPCDEHVVQLRDRIGVDHLLTADVGCRNTLFNAVSQSAAEAVPDLIREGVGSLRIELLNESDTEIRTIITAYRDLLAGRITGRDVWTCLQSSNRVGVTRGTLEERRNPLAIV